MTTRRPRKAPNNEWWRGGVIYQIYPRSFQDSHGDGVGDLNGITQRLDYVKALGVDAIWLSPFFKSPMRDFGYDVSDYRAVDPIFGTLDDFRTLVDRAHALGLKVIIDQVLSHTSDEHPWFMKAARAARIRNPTGTCGPMPSRMVRPPITGSPSLAAVPGAGTRGGCSITCTTSCPVSRT